MKRWLVFALSVAFAVGVALITARLSAARTDPPPVLTLSPGEAVEHKGFRLSNPVLTTIDAPEDMWNPPPPGAAIAWLTIDIEIVSELNPDESFCMAELRTRDGVYSSATDVSVALEQPFTCDKNIDSEPLSVGDSQTFTAAWIVPAPLDEEAEVTLHFPGQSAVEVLPQR